MCYVVGQALAQAGVTIEERWDSLLSLDLDPIATLPPTRRDAVLLRLIAAERSKGYAAKIAQEALERFGTPKLLKSLLKHLSTSNHHSLRSPARRHVLSRLKERFASEPKMVAIIESKLTKLPALPELVCTRKFRPRDAGELSRAQQDLLAEIGTDWTTNTGTVAYQNDLGEVEFESPLEDVSAFEVALDGKPAYVALLFADEDGACLDLDTSKIIASICQGSIQWKVKPPIAEALHAILACPPTASSGGRGFAKG